MPNVFTSNLLPDICNGTGTKKDPRMWDGKGQCKSKYQWPKTNKPTMTEWQEWQQTLTLALSLGKNWQLAMLLGKWGSTKCHADGYFLESDDNHLLKHRDNQWFRHVRALVWRLTLLYHHNPRLLAVDNEPRNLQYAKVILTMTTITAIRAAKIDSRQPHQPNKIWDLFLSWGIQLEIQGQEQIIGSGSNQTGASSHSKWQIISRTSRLGGMDHQKYNRTT